MNTTHDNLEKTVMNKGWIKPILLLTSGSVIVALIVIYSGTINVAANYPDHAFTRWLLHTTMEQSVKAHASDITVPELNQPDKILNGFRHYREMCTGCHLAPGITSSEIRQGLMPQPPVLQKTVNNWSPAELFWIIKNGVRMTAMPAWGSTHNDEKIWEMVAFLKQLPAMTEEQYHTLDQKAGKDDGDDD